VRNGYPHPPQDETEVKLDSDAEASLDRLKKYFSLMFVVSNQPDVARGLQKKSTVKRINGVIGSRLPITDFFVCYHDDDDGCDCRKPLPGLILRAAAHYDVDLQGSYLIGDRWRDIEAGVSAGCTTIWINRHYAERAPSVPASASVESLRQAVDEIISLEAGRLASTCQ